MELVLTVFSIQGAAALQHFIAAVFFHLRIFVNSANRCNAAVP
jgi:hypothetical protein